MLNEIYRLLEEAVNGEEIKAFAAEYQQYPLKLSFSSYAEGIAHLKECYEKLGLRAELLHFPADGKTVYADRHFPLAWDVDDAWAEVDGQRIADYAQATYSVIPFSADSGGVCEKTLIPIEDLPAEGTLEDCAALICNYPTGDQVRMLINRGCPAFFSTVNLEPIHPSLDDSRRWYNDLFAPGQIDCNDTTCVGFSITPRIARDLMAKYRAGETLTVRYEMKTRTYEGEAPAVTAVIPGTEDDRSFIISAHGYEPHATNNVAGVSAAMGAAKALMGLIESGKLPRPKHSIRFFHGLENFSLYAWSMANREKMKNALGGISTDSFGRYEAGGIKEHFVLRRCLNVHPTNQHAAARELLDWVCQARDIDFEVRESSSNNEELMQDPLLGPGWNLLYGSLWEEPRKTYPRCYFYHTDVDTVDQLSPEALSAAAVLSASLAYYMACGGDEQELAELAYTDWKRIVDAKCLEALRLEDTSPEARMLRAQRLALWRDLSVASGMEAIGNAGLATDFRAYTLQKVSAALTVLCGGAPAPMRHGGQDQTVLRRLVPGPLGLGTIPEELRPLAAESQGYLCREYWCLDPSGANLYLFDGKRTVFQVAQAAWATRAYGPKETIADFEKERNRYSKLAEVLLRAGLAEEVLPPQVTKEDILGGLRELGIQTGDKVMVHASLKGFGRVQGGADTVIDALLEAVGDSGILAMPAFTDCVDGSPAAAFDPAVTPPESWIGIIPETFRKRPGVCRSNHPTHSVCAAGKEAEAFLQQADIYDCFAKDGPWERLRSQGGKLLFLGEAVGSNTFLHACEAWYNQYLDETFGRIATPDGEKLVRIINYPGGCRGGWYKLGRKAPYYQKLLRRGLYRFAKVGNTVLTLCEAGPVAEAMKEILEKDPFILLHKRGCRDCARLRGKYHG